MQKITPFLWFNNQAEEAMRFYTSIFKDSAPGKIVRRGDAAPGPNDSVLTVTFRLFDQDFIALNGGPTYTFNPAISFVVTCQDQAEIDYYWEKLTADGGKPVQCGWLQDKFGVSWQIVPHNISDLVGGSNSPRTQRVMKALLQMVKLDIAALHRAADEP